VLEEEGQKFVPQVCTSCHAGQYAGGVPDLGSVFREFEPSSLVARAGITPQQADQEWFDLNRAVLSANEAIHSEGDGGVSGTDHAKASLAAYIPSIYSQTDPPISVPAFDPSHMSSSWRQAPGDAQYVAAVSGVWTNAVSVYCMGCHRINNLDFNQYTNFQMLGAEQGGVSVLERYITDNPNDPKRELAPWMPQSELGSKRIRADQTSLAAIQDWLTQNADPTTPQCKVTFTINNANMTVMGQELHILGDIDQLSNWDPGRGGLELQTSAATWPTWTGSRALPQGAAIQFKAVVEQNGNLAFDPGTNGGWENGANRTFTVPLAPSASYQGSWQF